MARTRSPSGVRRWTSPSENEQRLARKLIQQAMRHGFSSADDATSGVPDMALERRPARPSAWEVLAAPIADRRELRSVLTSWPAGAPHPLADESLRSKPEFGRLSWGPGNPAKLNDSSGFETGTPIAQPLACSSCSPGAACRTQKSCSPAHGAACPPRSTRTRRAWQALVDLSRYPAARLVANEPGAAVELPEQLRADNRMLRRSQALSSFSRW